MIGFTLKYLRLNAKISLRDLAQKVKKSHTYLARVESGDLNPSTDILATLSDIYGVTLHDGVVDQATWSQKIEWLHHNLLNADFAAVHAQHEVLKAQASDFEGSSLHGEYIFFDWVMEVFLSMGITDRMVNPHKLAGVLWEETSFPLRFLLLMALAKYFFHRWELNDALMWLEKATSVTQHPHDQAWITLEQASIEVHRFARHAALEKLFRARETFGYFNTYKRMAEADIKIDLYHARQINEDVIDYPSLHAKAQTFLLDVTDSEVRMIEGLRAQHLGDYDRAKKNLLALDLTHPQHYFNACMVLYLSGDREALNERLQKRPTTYVMPVVFTYGLEFLTHTVQNEPKRAENALKKYLKEGLKHRLYGETRRAQFELTKLYENTRRYKSALEIIESVTQAILNA